MIQRVEAGRELRQEALEKLGRSLAELLSQGVTSIHVDASKINEFDSEALEGLLEFDALARSRGLDVVILHPSPVFYSALRITGLSARLKVQVEAADSLAVSVSSGTQASAETAPARPAEPST
jgi:anti-anti-sigma regulatory factor